MNKTLTLLCTGAFLVTATSANAGLVFTETFEGYGNTDDNTVATYDKFPPTPTNWQPTDTGAFGAKNHGLNLDGTNTVYTFRYTNSGLTTLEGVLGNLTAGETYTISFDVSLDNVIDSPFDVGLLTFAPGASRNTVSSMGDGASAVLASVSGNYNLGGYWTATGGTVSGSTITFSYTADGTEGTLGQDLAVRLDGASTSANIDNVKVDIVPEPGTIALMAIGGMMVARRRRKK